MSATGTKRTFAFVAIKSAFDPKRTFSAVQITPLLDRGPVGNHLSTTHIIIGPALPHAQTAKQGYAMSGIVRSEIASDRERETYPIVYFEDMGLDIPVKGRGEGLACDAQEPSGFRPEFVIAAFDKAIDAAAEGTRLLQGEMIGIAQRNVNATLNQLWKLAGARVSADSGFAGCILSQSTRAFIRQVEEIQAVSTHVANGLEPIEMARWQA